MSLQFERTLMGDFLNGNRFSAKAGGTDSLFFDSITKRTETHCADQHVTGWQLWDLSTIVVIYCFTTHPFPRIQFSPCSSFCS